MRSTFGGHQRNCSVRHCLSLSHVFHVANPQVIGLPLGSKHLRPSGAFLGTATGSLLHDLMVTPGITRSTPGSRGAESEGFAVV